jgi:NAD(P)-dependent dehydrogenase (short-subunit alcohol dehydrogenase family)
MSEQKTIVISGTTSGIGRATALRLARENHNIITVNRPSSREEVAFQELQPLGTGEKHRYLADLSTEAGVREAGLAISREIPKVDVLINNAGVFKTKESFSADGEEMTFAVNVRAAAMLTGTLLPLLEQSGWGRVLFLSSELYKRAKVATDNPLSPGKFNSSRVYAHSKMLLTLLAGVLAEEYPATEFFSVHPGVIATDVFRDYPKFFTKLLNKMLPGPDTAAELLATLALEDSQATNGSYFMEYKPRPVAEPVEAGKIKASLLEYFRSLM